MSNVEPWFGCYNCPETGGPCSHCSNCDDCDLCFTSGNQSTLQTSLAKTPKPATTFAKPDFEAMRFKKAAGAQATCPNIHYMPPIRTVQNTIQQRKMQQDNINKQHLTEGEVFDILYDPHILKQEELELALLQEEEERARKPEPTFEDEHGNLHLFFDANPEDSAKDNDALYCRQARLCVRTAIAAASSTPTSDLVASRSVVTAAVGFASVALGPVDRSSDNRRYATPDNVAPIASGVRAAAQEMSGHGMNVQEAEKPTGRAVLSDDDENDDNLYSS
jgi:hypothetical protein